MEIRLLPEEFQMPIVDSRGIVLIMRIEVARLEHCREIAEIHVQSWQEAYRHLISADYLRSLSVERRETTWRETVLDGEPKVLVATDGNQIAGFIAFGSSRDEDAAKKTAEIWALYLAPPQWSQGVGRQLWLAAQEHIAAQDFESITLWVLADNERAVRFYEKAEFRPDTPFSRQTIRDDIPLKELRYVLSL